MTIKTNCIALLLVAFLAAVPLVAADGGPARYVVTVDASASQADVGALAARLAREYGGRLEPYAAEGFTGFVIILTPQRAQLLGGDPRIVSMREQRDEFMVTAPEVMAPSAKTALRPIVNAGSTLDFGTYTYDKSGNIHKIAGVSTDTYLYDHYNRVLSGTHTMPFPETPVSQQYTYDRYGNIATIKTTGQPDRILAVDKSTNQIDATNVVNANVKGTYDAAGNLITLDRGGVTGAFEYDGVNIVKESTIAGSRRIHIYGASDERLASFEGVTDFGTTGKQQWTVRDAGGQVLRRFIRENHSASLQWDEDYLYRGTQMLAAYVARPEKVLHFHPDHLGTPRLITGNGGAKVEESRYYAFGEELTLRLAGVEQKQFTGHERDTVAGAPGADVDYMHARYYGAWEGRFFAVDPVLNAERATKYPQLWNAYAYVGNNPLRYADPDGRDMQDFFNAVGPATAATGRDLLQFGKDAIHHDQVKEAFSGFKTAPANEKAMAIAIGIIAIADVGSTLVAPEKAALQTGASKAGAIMLGHFPGNKTAAAKIGAEFLDIANWTFGKNRGWLRDALRAGKDVFLSVDPTKVRPGSVTEKELQYLAKRGWQFVRDAESGFWKAVRTTNGRT